jgi:hypothetical protein
MQRIPRQQRRKLRTAKTEGIHFVRCRICGKHLCVISGRHLSTHGTERETYIEEFRLSPDELCAKDFRRLVSSRSDYYPHDKRNWIAVIKKTYKRDGQVFAGHIQKKYPHVYHQGVWLFGDWDNGLRAGGFEPERSRSGSIVIEEKFSRKIRRMRQNKLPLYAFYVMKHHPKVFYGALRQCGSWSKALRAEGIDVPKPPYVGRLAVLRALRNFLDRHPKCEIPQALRLAAVYYLGSLEKAMAALKTDPTILAGWSTAKILATVSQIHKSKESLAYSVVRRKYPALVSAAEAYLGSWGRTLYANGIDPNLYFVHRTWRKTKESVKRDSQPVATYLNRPCPRCKGYLGIVLREWGRNMPVRAINGHCVECGHRLAWIVIKGNQAARHH